MCMYTFCVGKKRLPIQQRQEPTYNVCFLVYTTAKVIKCFLFFRDYPKNIKIIKTNSFVFSVSQSKTVFCIQVYLKFFNSRAQESCIKNKIYILIFVSPKKSTNLATTKAKPDVYTIGKVINLTKLAIGYMQLLQVVGENVRNRT